MLEKLIRNLARREECGQRVDSKAWRRQSCRKRFWRFFALKYRQHTLCIFAQWAPHLARRYSVTLLSRTAHTIQHGGDNYYPADRRTSLPIRPRCLGCFRIRLGFCFCLAALSSGTFKRLHGSLSMIMPCSTFGSGEPRSNAHGRNQPATQSVCLNTGSVCLRSSAGWPTDHDYCRNGTPKTRKLSTLYRGIGVTVALGAAGRACSQDSGRENPPERAG